MEPPSGNLSITFEDQAWMTTCSQSGAKNSVAVLASTCTQATKSGDQPNQSIIYKPSVLQSNFAYGKLYSQVRRNLYAYDAKTGNRLWDLPIMEPYGGSEVLWSNNWPMAIMFITDGKIYIANAEHSANQPLPRDGPFMAVDASNGSIVFRIDGAFRQPRWAGQAGIADGIITLFNTYDNQVYA